MNAFVENRFPEIAVVEALAKVVCPTTFSVPVNIPLVPVNPEDRDSCVPEAEAKVVCPVTASLVVVALVAEKLVVVLFVEKSFVVVPLVAK